MRKHLVYISIRYDYVLRLKEIIYALVITSNPICAWNYLRYQQKRISCKEISYTFYKQIKEFVR